MTVIPHPPYVPDLVPCDFFLFTKLKLRIKGRRFDTIEKIQEESQRILDTIPKRDFQNASKHGRNAGTAVFVQKGSTLKVMEEFNILGKQTSFYKYCPGTFGYILVQLYVHIEGCVVRMKNVRVWLDNVLNILCIRFVVLALVLM